MLTKSEFLFQSFNCLPLTNSHLHPLDRQPIIGLASRKEALFQTGSSGELAGRLPACFNRTPIHTQIPWSAFSQVNQLTLPVYLADYRSFERSPGHRAADFSPVFFAVRGA